MKLPILDIFDLKNSNFIQFNLKHNENKQKKYKLELF